MLYAGARPCIFYPNFILLKFGYSLDKFEKPTLFKFYPYSFKAHFIWIEQNGHNTSWYISTLCTFFARILLGNEF